MENKLIITTSWDDGHELDIRVADLLEKYGIKGTFYVPLRNSEKPVMDDNLLKEIAKSHEIGGHTVNHIYLNTLNEKEAAYEIFACKGLLEDKIAKPVSAFCYPGGKYSQRDIDLVHQAGYLFGRTTRLLRNKVNPDSKLMDTTVQVYNHDAVILNGHCMKKHNFLPIMQNLFFIKADKNFSKLVEDSVKRLVSTGGVFHLWGHSWEIEEYGLWSELELVLKLLSNNSEINYLNNSECWNYTSGKTVHN